MARPLRLQLAGGWYHVMSRGNGGQAIFLDDTDRRRFMGLVSELPDRFSFEVHGFVLMGNHYHLLLRTREANLSEGLRWLNVSYTVRFNLVHRRSGHVLQGRFKSVLILDETRLDEVARYVHLNPVRVGGLGLGKPDQRRARVIGCEDPGAELVSARLRTLREYPWSSWRVYSGTESRVGWLETGRIGVGCGGRSRKEQARALREYTEAPIRQGRMESPWEGLVGGVVLGEEADAVALLKGAAARPEEQTGARRLQRAGRPSWPALIGAAERILGRKWEEMTGRHGDWGRDAVLAVGTRHLGWRLAEAVREIPGLRYNAAAQGVRRFWKGVGPDREKARFVAAMRRQKSHV